MLGIGKGRLAGSVSPSLIEAQDVSVRFNTPQGRLTAIKSVTLGIERGECLGVVGESGSGKSTLARALLGLTPVARGKILYNGVDISKMSPRAWRRTRRRLQIVFQDPLSALNPRLRAGEAIAEPIRVHRLRERRGVPQRVGELFDQVGLSRRMADRFPHEFSGGQQQRIVIARALAAEPEFMVCDEPTSSLDVSIQAQVLGLIQDLQRQLNVTLLFIAHALPVIRRLAGRVAVMYLGRVVEMGSRDDIYSRPSHPYTLALLSAFPATKRADNTGHIVLRGDLPSPIGPPSGCAFHTRCWLYEMLGRPEVCRVVEPPLAGSVSAVACHFAQDARAASGTAAS